MWVPLNSREADRSSVDESSVAPTLNNDAAIGDEVLELRPPPKRYAPQPDGHGSEPCGEEHHLANVRAQEHRNRDGAQQR